MRPGRRSNRASTRNFNSRTYTRCDILGRLSSIAGLDFNSRTYTRCDHSASSCALSHWDFNSRTYTRCDPSSKTGTMPTSHFNSRTYTRCDEMPANWNLNSSTFQFTHLHEVRHRRNCLNFDPAQFQFTHLHEVRLHIVLASEDKTPFQFTHLHEVRQMESRIRIIRQEIISIHAPTRGATVDIVLGRRHRDDFNSRTYTRCDSSPKNPLSQAPNSYHFANHKIIPFSQLKFLYQHLSFIGQISIAKIPTFFCSLSLRN